MKTSPAGVGLIKKFEGLRLTAYQDVVGVWTIGFGDTGADVWPGLTITGDEAVRRLANRLAREFEPGVSAAIVGIPTTQGQFDAMVSLAYNIGVGAFRCSSVARFHRAGDHQAAADAFRLWNKAGQRVLEGLMRRREDERRLYLRDGPAAIEPPIRKRKPRRLVELAIVAHGKASRRLQTRLKEAGFDPGPIDGIWGEASREALRSYVKEYHP